MARREKKKAFFETFESLTSEYTKIFVVGCDHVGSLQLQQTRIALRGKAVVLMGKNTMVRKIIRDILAKNPESKLAALLPHIKQNVGFVFCKGELAEVKKVLLANKVAAVARQGAISPVTVVVPAGNTGMEPTKTSFFQALNITTKITKGTVEIISDVTLLKEGDKVGNSEAALLQMLGIKPFSYGLAINVVFDDGEIYEPSVLEISDEVLAAKFATGVAEAAALSLGANQLNDLSMPHLMADAYKNMLAIAMETAFSWPEADQFKTALANAPAVSAAPVAASAGAAAPAAAAKVEEEEEDEEGGDMGFGLFD